MKKLLSIIAALVMCFSVTACGPGGLGSTGGNGGGNGSDAVTGNVEVFYWKSGVGIEFMEKMKEEFEATHEGITIDLSPSSEDSTVFYNTIEQGARINTIDLYIGTMYAFYSRTQFLEPLDDLLKEKADGETKTLGEKFGTAISYKSNGKTYALPWQSSISGMVYNKKMFADNGWTVPRTTDELVSLADAIRAKNLKNDGDTVTPFISFANGYWNYMITPWWAQYEGYENFNNFWEAKYVKPDGSIDQPSNMVWRQEGRLEALKVLEALIAPDNSLYPGSNSHSHTDAQTFFANGKAAMMANGAWLEVEAGKDMSNFAMMKTPVLSSLGTKLGISEAQLTATIDYVDGTTTTAPAGVTEEQIARIREARSMAWSESGNFHVVIPKYSDVKGAAKEFLKFFYSDKGLRIMEDYIHTVSFMEFDKGESDTSKFSSFEKSAAEVQQNATYLFKKMSYPLFHLTDIEEAWATNPALTLANSNKSSRLTAEQLFNQYATNMTGSRWTKYLMQAGLD